MKLVVRFLVLFLLLFLSSSTESYADAATEQFAELKKQYLTLRNTDLLLHRADEWVKLARQFEQFSDRNASFSETPSALLNAASLMQILFRHFGGADRAQKAADLLERIAREYPGHALVDDALLQRGDLLLYDLQHVDAAHRAFEELARAYPGSELVAVAEARMKSIADGSYNEQSAIPVQRDRIQAEGQTAPVIVIDPGHGGEDFGAQGVAGLLEKDVVLAVAFELERLLKEKMNAVVRLTRRTDIFVPLEARTQLANDFAADMFISLHTNASPKKNVNGFEIYYLDNTQDQASQKLAERENASTQFADSGSDLQFMLSDLIQSAKLDDSIIFANLIHRSLKDSLSPAWSSTRALGVKKAPFYVLVGAHMPCVLVEMFFIDNKIDGPLLAQRTFRTDLAYALYDGIKEFYEKHLRRQ